MAAETLTPAAHLTAVLALGRRTGWAITSRRPKTLEAHFTPMMDSFAGCYCRIWMPLCGG